MYIAVLSSFELIKDNYAAQVLSSNSSEQALWWELRTHGSGMDICFTWAAESVFWMAETFFPCFFFLLFNMICGRGLKER